MLTEFEEETMQEESAETAAEILMYIKSDWVSPGEHRGRYNAHKENEIATVFKNSDGIPPSNKDIVIHTRGGSLINISTLNPNLETTIYVFFYPQGNRIFSQQQQQYTVMFYSHQVSVCRQFFTPVLYGQKLFEQYLVDAYVEVDWYMLFYVRNHQKKLRVDNYIRLADHVYRAAE